MKIFDCFVRSDTRNDADLKNLSYFDTDCVLTTAHAPRPFETADELLDYLDGLLVSEYRRLKRCGLKPRVALGVHPHARPRRTHHEIWRELPSMLAQPEVGAIGELSVLEDVRREWEFVERQIRIGLDCGALPLLVSPPPHLRATVTYKMMDLLQRLQYPSERVLFTLLEQHHVEPVLVEGFNAGLSVNPVALSPQEAAQVAVEMFNRRGHCRGVMFNSALSRGAGDVLSIPKAIGVLNEIGVPVHAIEAMVYGNALELFGHTPEHGSL